MFGPGYSAVGHLATLASADNRATMSGYIPVVDVQADRAGVRVIGNVFSRSVESPLVVSHEGKRHTESDTVRVVTIRTIGRWLG